MGNMGRHHADYLLTGTVSRAQLTAVGSPSPQKLEKYRSQGLKIFSDGLEMIRSGEIDALLVATPHFQHTTLGIAALEAGLHVMVEKPISAHKADAARLVAAAAERPRLVFGAMFQLRVEPRYMKMRKLIADGDLGRIVRINWIITDWFRTEAYYASGGWRATWRGEGGGVLINQCLHQLDMLQWLCGMPGRVRGFCQLGRYHDIEVEDNITAYLEWSGGATGVFVSSTGEAPGSNRFEIAGTRGRLVLENNRLVFTRNESDMEEFSRKATVGFAKPEVSNVEVPFENAGNQHAILMQNFVDAILDGTALIAPGPEGIPSIELANSMLFSSMIDRTIELPMDGAAYESKLNELIAASTVKKNVVEVSGEDFTKSFVR